MAGDGSGDFSFPVQHHLGGGLDLLQIAHRQPRAGVGGVPLNDVGHAYFERGGDVIEPLPFVRRHSDVKGGRAASLVWSDDALGHAVTAQSKYSNAETSW